MAKGKKTGGRSKGTPNRASETVQALMDRLGVDVFHAMGLIVARRVPCGTCIDKDLKPTGVTKVQLEDGKHASDCAITEARLSWGQLVCTCGGMTTRVCQSCKGDLWEKIAIDTQLKAASDIAQYLQPKRKAIEITNPDNSLKDLARAMMESRAARLKE